MGRVLRVGWVVWLCASGVASAQPGLRIRAEGVAAVGSATALATAALLPELRRRGRPVGVWLFSRRFSHAGLIRARCCAELIEGGIDARELDSMWDFAGVVVRVCWDEDLVGLECWDTVERRVFAVAWEVIGAGNWRQALYDALAEDASETLLEAGLSLHLEHQAEIQVPFEGCLVAEDVVWRGYDGLRLRIFDRLLEAGVPLDAPGSTHEAPHRLEVGVATLPRFVGCEPVQAYRVGVRLLGDEPLRTVVRRIEFPYPRVNRFLGISTTSGSALRALATQLGQRAQSDSIAFDLTEQAFDVPLQRRDFVSTLRRRGVTLPTGEDAAASPRQGRLVTGSEEGAPWSAGLEVWDRADGSLLWAELAHRGVAPAVLQAVEAAADQLLALLPSLGVQRLAFQEPDRVARMSACVVRARLAGAVPLQVVPVAGTAPSHVVSIEVEEVLEAAPPRFGQPDTWTSTVRLTVSTPTGEEVVRVEESVVQVGGSEFGFRDLDAPRSESGRRRR